MANKKTDTEETKVKKSSVKKTNTKKVEKKVQPKEAKKVNDESKKTKEKKETVEKQHELEKTVLLEVPDDVVKDALKHVNKEAKKQARQELVGKVIEELIAFIFLIVIICLVVFGVGYWYENYYDDSKNTTTVENDNEESSNNYKIVSYEGNSSNIKVINDKYIVEFDKDNKKIAKILDKDLTVLYEGSLEVTNIVPDVNGNIYAYLDEDAESENLITLYKLTDGKFEEIDDFSSVSYYFNPLIYRTSDNYDYLLGFYGEENSDLSKSIIYDLTGEKYEIDGYVLTGDYEKNSTDSSVITRNKNYVAVKSISSKRYGLYDLNNNQMLFESLYDELHCTFDDNFVVKKDGKTGILNNKSKKIVDFQYDFIDINEDYYIVSKDNKLAVMDNEFKLVTGFDFDYQINNTYKEYLYTGDNSFKSYKINNSYLLITNYNEKNGNYNNHLAYFINSDGKYEKYEETNMNYVENDNFLYSYFDDTDVYTIYDIDENGISNTYEVSLNGYDLSNVKMSKFSNDIVRINNDIFINYKENKELDDQDNVKELIFDIYSIMINYDEHKVYIYENDKELSSYSFKSDFNYNIREDGSIYFVVDKSYISIEKIS